MGDGVQYVARARTIDDEAQQLRDAARVSMDTGDAALRALRDAEREVRFAYREAAKLEGVRDDLQEQVKRLHAWREESLELIAARNEELGRQQAEMMKVLNALAAVRELRHRWHASGNATRMDCAIELYGVLGPDEVVTVSGSMAVDGQTAARKDDFVVSREQADKLIDLVRMWRGVRITAPEPEIERAARSAYESCARDLKRALTMRTRGDLGRHVEAIAEHAAETKAAIGYDDKAR